MRNIIFIFLLLSGLAKAQTPPRTDYLTQTAKWKMIKPLWLDSGAYITKIPKYAGQSRILVYDSLTGKVGYKFVSGAIWGSITGTLSNQSDLQAALDAKQATLSAGNGWLLGSNTGYVDSTKFASLHGNTWGNGMFMGSTNNRSLNWRVNNIQRMRLDSSGKAYIGDMATANTGNNATLNLGDAGGSAGGIHLKSSSGYAALSFTAGNVAQSQIGQQVSSGGFANTMFFYNPNSAGFVFSEKINIGSLAAAKGMLTIPIAPTSTPNYGLVSAGSAPWDGSTPGYFTGSANGTLIAGNTASGFSGDLLNLQIAGVGKFKIKSTGGIDLGGSGDNTQIVILGDGTYAGMYSPAYSSSSTNIINFKDYNGNQRMTLNMSSGSAGHLTLVGNVTGQKYYVSALNSAPSSASDTGTTGEIRFTSDYIFVCTATNTWKRIAISTW